MRQWSDSRNLPPQNAKAPVNQAVQTPLLVGSLQEGALWTQATICFLRLDSVLRTDKIGRYWFYVCGMGPRRHGSRG